MQLIVFSKLIISLFEIFSDVQSGFRHVTLIQISILLIRYAILNEVWRLVENGYLNVRDIDAVMSDGLGMRYAFLGPLETAHLNAEGWLSYCDRYSKSINHVS